MFRHTYETIKEFIDNKTHFELLQDYFIDTYTLLKLKCKDCNREYYVTFTNLRMAVSRGRINCEECYKFERELPKILDYFRTKGEGCELVIDRSKNLHKDYLEIICPKCNEHFLNKYNDFKNKVHKMCNNCMNDDKNLPTNTLTYEKVKERIENNSECLLISTEYKNSKTPLEILCSCKQHTFFTTLPSFEKGKTRCKKCSTEYRRSLKAYTYEQVLNFVDSTNCKLITTEYINAQTPMEFTCDVDGCNEIFITTYNIFKNSGRRKCTKHSYEEVGKKNALTYDYVKEYIENLGSKLRSDIYINNSEKIEVICTECKTPYFTTFAEISTKKRVRCGACGNKAGGKAQLISYDKIKSTIKKEGCILLSKEYKGAYKKLNILCSCGKHKFQTTFAGFKDGKTKCDYCVNQIQWNYELISKFVKNNSTAKLLSTEYKNTHANLSFECECGNQFTTSWHDFYDESRKKRQCNTCGSKEQRDNQRLPYEDVYKEIAESGCELISTEYVNVNDKLKIKCVLCGKEFTSTLSAFRKRNVKACQVCNKSMSAGERKFKELLELNNINFVTQHTYDDCKYKGKLRFDFLLTDYNYIIEVDGLFHFKSIPYFGGEKKLKETKIRDGIKNRYCKTNSIPLIRIPYYEKQMNDFIKRSEVVIGHILSGKFEQILSTKLKLN